MSLCSKLVTLVLVSSGLIFTSCGRYPGDENNKYVEDPAGINVENRDLPGTSLLPETLRKKAPLRENDRAMFNDPEFNSSVNDTEIQDDSTIY